MQKYHFDKPIAISGGQIASYEGDLSLLTNLNAGSNPRLTIADETGNVGVGTLKPVERLHVNGNMRVDGLLLLQNTNGSVKIETQNAGTCHFVTDRENYYFNKEIMVDSGRIGSYDEDLVLSAGGAAQATIRRDTGNLELRKALVFEKGRWQIEINDWPIRGGVLPGIEMNIKHGDKVALSLKDNFLVVPGLTVQADSITLGGVSISVVDGAGAGQKALKVGNSIIA
jgi:hypothetical protein